MKRSSLLELLVCAVVIAGCVAPPVIVVPAETSTGSWEQYANSEAGFSIDYPAYWTEESLPDQGTGHEGVALRGPEGAIELTWGTGFGGACPSGYETVAVAEGELPTCHTVNADGTENWEQINKDLGDIGFSARAYTSSADPASRELILDSLATLSFAGVTAATATPAP